MDNIAGTKSSLSWAVNISVVLLVVLWLIPTIGLLVSSFRDRDQISATGWWLSPFPVEQNYQAKAPAGDVKVVDGIYIIEGNVFGDETGAVARFGGTRAAPTEFKAGDTAQLTKDRTLTVQSDGNYVYTSPADIKRDPSVYYSASSPPDFSLSNYRTILASDNMDRAFINTLTVTIPATIIPILIAAFAAYALAWMDFKGRGFLIALVVGLLVVPLQLALVPLLTLHNKVGIGQSFLGIWMAHTGFGLPLAIYLLRNYMVGLPRDIIESAKVDGATDFQVFTKIVLPLSFPALASFAIFQFLWTWNDLLVAKVFLPSNSESWVMTVKIADDLLGSKGGDWGILAAAAFISIAVPLIVFFTMQRYLVRGLLAGSVK
ncbi:carbohydrate ABC transporter permease [Litoreibacter janthinus]|uniref:Maltose ABC transporter membrane protein/trehalose ABC transporter membrane protein/sucrose ABC transporter membrane protein n=1 Tax=Litoreibacter janthinus TaxID=670154 RepID=A0A1I6H7Q5_9RHOB|nr:carbohydrate ABC transporter permease [Litoreibacter janthinus]SFR50596.1 maltose ABC transporter membrane protein/trehalose ABC transporter membrane protein/sucrose ABC transporter membrane protein [Litoreibacter janthinus]